MLIELFIFFEIIMIGVFMTAFFTKHEILWALALVLSGVMMFTSYNVEYSMYTFNTTIQAYAPTLVSYQFPYLIGINMLFSALALLLGLFDLFEKYGIQLDVFKKKKDGF